MTWQNAGEICKIVRAENVKSRARDELMLNSKRQIILNG